MILGLKLGRRLLGAAAFDQEQFTFADSRYVGTRRTVPETTAAYFRRLIEQTRPLVICYYAPTTPDAPESLTDEVVRLLEKEAALARIPVKGLTRSDIFGSFGLVALKTREALLEVMVQLWPDLSDVKPRRQSAVAEAAVAALVGELRQKWPPT